MPDVLTCEERSLIDAHLSSVGATVIPRGVGGAEDVTPVWRRLSAEDRRRIDARRRNIRDAAAKMDVGQIAGRFGVSREMVYRTLSEANMFAVGMADRRG